MREEVMQKQNTEKEYSTDIELFHLTEREEALIMRATKYALEFMKEYGKGAQPQMVDLRHYANSIKEEIND